MNTETSKKLEAFVKHVQQKTAEVQSLKPKEAEKVQMELAAYIGAKMQELMAEGADINVVQEKLRSAMNYVPNSYAPSVEEADETSIESLENLNPQTYMFAVKNELLDAFFTGELSEKEFIRQIADKTWFVAKLLDVMQVVLGEYGKDKRFETFAAGGEIVAGPDGEALIPQWLEGVTPEGQNFAICEAATYKEAFEINDEYELIKNMAQEDFFARWNLNKFAKYQGLGFIEKLSLKKYEEEFCYEMLQEFLQIQNFYLEAAKGGNAVVYLNTY